MKPLPARKKPVNLNFKQTWIVVGGLIAYTLSFAALGEWKGWWDKYKTVPGSPKDIANRELMAIERAKRKKLWEDVFTTNVRPDAIEAISDEAQAQRIKSSEGIIESADRKTSTSGAVFTSSSQQEK